MKTIFTFLAFMLIGLTFASASTGSPPNLQTRTEQITKQVMVASHFEYVAQPAMVEMNLEILSPVSTFEKKGGYTATSEYIAPTKSIYAEPGNYRQESYTTNLTSIACSKKSSFISSPLSHYRRTSWVGTIYIQTLLPQTFS